MGEPVFSRANAQFLLGLRRSVMVAPLGLIMPWAGSANPSFPPNWQPCRGQLLSVGKYGNLFKIIGNKFGGDGSTTFALPNLQGTFVGGIGGSMPTPFASGGNAYVALDASQIPYHDHSVAISNAQSMKCSGAVQVMIPIDTGTSSTNVSNTPAANRILGSAGRYVYPGSS